MKTQRLSSSIGLVACALAFCLLGEVRGQAAAPAAPSSDILRIRKVTELGRDMFQRAPSMGNRSPKQKDWGVLDVTFDSAPEWIDEMTVTFTVMLQNKKAKQGEPAFSLLTLTSEYRHCAGPRPQGGRGDPARGDGTPWTADRSGAVLPRRPVDRRERRRGRVPLLPGEMVGEPQRHGSRERQKRDGYMIERSKSPFALVDIDSYEASR